MCNFRFIIIMLTKRNHGIHHKAHDKYYTSGCDYFIDCHSNSPSSSIKESILSLFIFIQLNTGISKTMPSMPIKIKPNLNCPVKTLKRTVTEAVARAISITKPFLLSSLRDVISSFTCSFRTSTFKNQTPIPQGEKLYV